MKNQGVSFRKPVVATELRHGRDGKGSRVVASNGELNANDKKDLLRNISKFLETSSAQGVITESEAVSRQELAKVHKQLITAAFDSEEAHKELGSTIADELYLAANREGFMRRFMSYQELTQGNIPRVKMRLKNVVATVAGGPTQIFSQIVRDNTYYPTEFNIMARPFIEEREIQQSVGDVLEEKFVEAQESIMVAEDRTWYKMATATVNQSNPYTTVTGTLSPSSFMAVKTLVTRWNIPAAYWLIASDIWNDIVGDTQFSNLIDPVSKHELLLTGQLGTILGLSVYTDAYRHPQHKVLNQGEFFVVGDAVNHGQYTDRGGVNSVPIDGSTEKTAGRGWMLTELMSMVITNGRSVAKARRV